MERGITIRLLTIGISSLLVGCATDPPAVWGSHPQEAAIGFEAGEAIALLVKSHIVDEKETVNDVSPTAIERCIIRALQDENGRFRVSQPGQSDVRYLIEVVVNTGKHAEHMVSSGGGAGSMGFYANFYNKWVQRSDFRASVFDVKRRELVGTVESGASGEQAAGIGLFIIVPYPYFSLHATESTACKRFGAELAKFLSNKD